MSPSDSTRVRWLLVVFSYVLVVAVAFGGVVYYRRDQCDQRRHDVAQLRSVVIAATEPPTAAAAGTLDLTKAEGFDQLDPTMQTWARSVQQMIAARPAAASSVRETLLAVIRPPNC